MSAKVLSVLGVLRNSEIFSVTDGEKATGKELGDDIRKVGKSSQVGSWRPWRGLSVLSYMIWATMGKQRNNMISHMC